MEGPLKILEVLWHLTVSLALSGLMGQSAAGSGRWRLAFR